MVKEIKEAEFNDVISTGKVVVDCYAPWCGPLMSVEPCANTRFHSYGP